MTTPHLVYLSYSPELAEYPSRRTYVDAALDAVRQASFVAMDMRDLTADPQPAADVCETAIRNWA